MRLVVCRDIGDDDGVWHVVEIGRAAQHGQALCGVHPGGGFRPRPWSLFRVLSD